METRNKKKLFGVMRTAFLLTGLLFSTHALLFAGDVDVKLTTADGSTKFSIQDSASAEVASVNSNGGAVFDTITQAGTGGNLIVSQNSLQSGATFYVSSGTIANQFYVGNVITVGNSGAYTDNYIAYPMRSGAALAAKQVVVISPVTGNVVTTNIASSVTVVGITVSATGGANETVWVATSGIVTNVPCAATMTPGTRACTSTTQGDVGTCASATNDAAGIGKMMTSCTGASAGTVLLLGQ